MKEDNDYLYNRVIPYHDDFKETPDISTRELNKIIKHDRKAIERQNVSKSLLLNKLNKKT